MSDASDNPNRQQSPEDAKLLIGRSLNTLNPGLSLNRERGGLFDELYSLSFKDISQKQF